MHELEQWLRRVSETFEGPYLRPFGPNARSCEARVFLVGTNPSTPIRNEFTSFDAYWHALTVDTGEFDRVYRSLNSGGITDTTRNTRRLVDATGSVGFLMTNAYPYPARRPKQIPNTAAMAQLGLKIILELLRGIRPRAIVFHGTPAVELGRRLTRCQLDRSIPVSEQSWSFGIAETQVRCSAFAIPHLCGAGAPKGYSFDEVYTVLPALLRALAADQDQSRGQ